MQPAVLYSPPHVPSAELPFASPPLAGLTYAGGSFIAGDKVA